MRSKIPWTILGVTALLSGCVTKSTYLRQKAASDQLAGDKAALENQLSGLRQDHQALQQDLAGAKSENQKLLSTLEANKGELSRRVAELTRQNQDLAQQLRDAQRSKDAELAKVRGTYDQLVGNLKDQINAGQIQITQLAGRLSVNMVDKILFNSGEASVKPEGQQVLQKVGTALKTIQDKAIRVEGHTDNVPISGALKSRFPSNWELSTARATAVVRYLQDQAGVPAERLIAAGYGEYRPVAANDTPEGRAQNRRIEIVLVPIEGVSASSAPVTAVPATEAPKP